MTSFVRAASFAEFLRAISASSASRSNSFSSSSSCFFDFADELSSTAPNESTAAPAISPISANCLNVSKIESSAESPDKLKSRAERTSRIIPAAFFELASERRSFFSVSMPPFFDVLSAVVFAFMLGLGVSSLTAKGRGETLRNLMKDFSSVIERALSRFVIPLLPVYVIGTFASITFEGESTIIFKSMWKAYIMMIVLHLIFIITFYAIACVITRKNMLTMLKNELPGYATALGTQSSAATIPVNLKCAEKNGVSADISAFVIPLGANIHMPGSMITIVSIALATMMMFSKEYDFRMFLTFIAVLGFVTIAAPGAPGGSIMSAIPFIGILGLSSTGPIASLLIVLYITQDSFGTACNVACDTALAMIIDKISNAIRQ